MGEFTIDELARRAGTTSRNVRAYQERGLLPPPRLVGRVGYYTEGHLARLRHIAELGERGFSLASMAALFEAWERGYGLADVLGFEEALAAPWGSEPTQVLGVDQLTAVFGIDTAALAQAVRVGLLVPEGDGYRVVSPRLLEASRSLVEAGIPLRPLLDEAELLIADLDRVADRWVALFKEHLWDESVRRGMPPDDLQALTDFLRRVRPLLDTIVSPLLAQAMARKADAMTIETFGSKPPKRKPRAKSAS